MLNIYHGKKCIPIQNEHGHYSLHFSGVWAGWKGQGDDQEDEVYIQQRELWEPVPAEVLEEHWGPGPGPNSSRGGGGLHL